jgi:hypothetical protein
MVTVAAVVCGGGGGGGGGVGGGGLAEICSPDKHASLFDTCLPPTLQVHQNVRYQSASVRVTCNSTVAWQHADAAVGDAPSTTASTFASEAINANATAHVVRVHLETLPWQLEEVGVLASVTCIASVTHTLINGAAAAAAVHSTSNAVRVLRTKERRSAGRDTRVVTSSNGPATITVDDAPFMPMG